MPVPVSNYTQMPNALIDAMPSMGEAEFRVVVAIARKTFGWQKTRDRISLTQLESMTGLSRQGVVNGVEQAQAHGWVVRFETPKGNEWEIAVNDVDQSSKLTGQVVNVVDQQVVNVVDTQKKPVKQKDDEDDEERLTPHQKAVRFAKIFETELRLEALPEVRREMEIYAARFSVAYFRAACLKMATGTGRSWNYLKAVLDNPNPAPKPTAPRAEYRGKRVSTPATPPPAPGPMPRPDISPEMMDLARQALAINARQAGR